MGWPLWCWIVSHSFLTSLLRTIAIFKVNALHNHTTVVDDFGYVIPGKGKERLVNIVDNLPSTMQRQVMCNTSNNSGNGALTMVPLCRGLSGTKFTLGR